MKKHLLFLLALVALCSTPTTLSATTDNPSGQPSGNPKPVIFNPTPPNSDTHRSVLSAFEAYYKDGFAYITFNVDLGCVNIEIDNITTGESWGTAHQGIGQEVLYISDESGLYYIYIVTEDNTYVGEFVL